MLFASRWELTTPLMACSVNRSNKADVHNREFALPLAVDLQMKAETALWKCVAGKAPSRGDGLVRKPLHVLCCRANLIAPRTGCLTKFDCEVTSVRHRTTRPATCAVP